MGQIKPHPAHPKSHPAHPHLLPTSPQGQVTQQASADVSGPAARSAGHSAAHAPKAPKPAKRNKAAKSKPAKASKHGPPPGSRGAARGQHRGHGVPAGGKGHSKGTGHRPAAPGSTSTPPEHSGGTPVGRFGPPPVPPRHGTPPPHVRTVHHPVHKPTHVSPAPPSQATGELDMRPLHFSLGLLIPLAIALVVAGCGAGLLLLTRRRSN